MDLRRREGVRGEMDQVTNRCPWADPYADELLSPPGPVQRTVLDCGVPVYLVSGFQAARRALAHPSLSKDVRHSPAAARALMDAGLLEDDRYDSARHMLNLDGPAHARLRALVASQFTPRRVRALRGSVQRTADRLVEGLLPHGRAELMDQFCFPVATAVICELLGVPEADRGRFRAWAEAIADPSPASGGGRALQNIERYFDTLVRDKAAAPGDDLLSRLVHGDGGGTALTRAELRAMAYLLLIAGFATSVHFIGNALAAVLSDPRLLHELRSTPERIPSAVEELLRFASPVRSATWRFTSTDVALGDMVIPAGEVVLISLAAADRDPGRFADPHRVDLSRPGGAHLAFGHGPHFCLGASLARLEAQIALATVLGRLPDLRLASPRRADWSPGFFVRGPATLPVAYTPPPLAAGHDERKH